LELQAERERYELKYRLSLVKEEFFGERKGSHSGPAKFSVVKLVAGVLFPKKAAVVFRWFGVGIRVWQTFQQLRASVPDATLPPPVFPEQLRKS
jgi:hypothetical protein